MSTKQQLMDLPHELLHKVLAECEPADLHSLKMACRALKAFLENNRQLFKEMYLKRLDSPQEEPDWEHELKKFIRFKEIVECDDIERKAANLPFVAEKISQYLSTSSPIEDEPSLTISLLTEISDNPQNRLALLCNSSLFQRVRTGTPTVPFITATYWDTPIYTLSEEQRQASAKLHCLYGTPLTTTLQSSTPRAVTRTTRIYPYAVSKVYDLRNYTDGSFWGPFQNDGQATVDWEKMEAIMVVLGHNLKEHARKSSGAMKNLCSSIWSEPWKDAAKNSCHAFNVPRLDEPGLSLDQRDPYGITGTYLRIVCFLDFTELFTYNFVAPVPPRDDVPRPPLDTIEATRMIFMDIKVTKIEQPDEDDDGQENPVVHFRGMSRSMDASYDPNANSNIRGTVRQTKEGEIRWTTYSIYHGEERWKSESIQVGGIQSARGAIGNWFDKDYDIHGPAGPTAFWKVSEDVLAEMLDEEEEEQEEDDEDWNDGGDEEDSDEEEGDDVETVMMLSDEGGVISLLMGMGEHIDTSGQGNSSGNNGPNVEGPDDPKDRDSMDDQTS